MISQPSLVNKNIMYLFMYLCFMFTCRIVAQGLILALYSGTHIGAALLVFIQGRSPFAVIVLYSLNIMHLDVMHSGKSLRYNILIMYRLFFQRASDEDVQLS